VAFGDHGVKPGVPVSVSGRPFWLKSTFSSAAREDASVTIRENAVARIAHARRKTVFRGTEGAFINNAAGREMRTRATGVTGLGRQTSGAAPSRQPSDGVVNEASLLHGEQSKPSRTPKNVPSLTGASANRPLPRGCSAHDFPLRKIFDQALFSEDTCSCGGKCLFVR